MFIQRAYNNFEIEIEDAPSFANTYSTQFDGIDDYVNVGADVSLDIFGGDFTISLWAKWGAQTTNSNGIINFGANANKAMIGLGFSTQYGKITFGTRLIPNGALYDMGSGYDDDEWHNIVCTLSGTTPTCYVDGFDITSTGSTANIFMGTTNDIGVRDRGGQDRFFSGNIDECSIWDSVIPIGDVWDGSGKPTDLSLLATSPLSWWRMGENGSWKSPQWLLPNNENKDKVSNYSLEFDGLDDDFTSGDLSSLVDNKSKLSISFWVNLPDASEINRITGKYGGSLTKWLGVTCTSNKVTFAVSNIGSSLAYAETSAVLTDNTWHHVACVFDGTQAIATDRIKIYIDNTDETFAFNGTLPTSTYDFTLEPTNPTWYVGQSGLQLGVNELRGKLNEYSIYSDVALTDLDVNEIYNGGVPNNLNTLSVTPDLWYRMGEEANFTSNWLVDNSALDNYSKRSFYFDGTDQYLNTGALSTLANASSFSISLWVKKGTTAGNYRRICGKYASASDNIFIEFSGTNIFPRFYVTNGGVSSYVTANVGLTFNTWQNLVVVFDGSLTGNQNRAKIYLDGNNITATDVGTIPATTSADVTDFYFGKANGLGVFYWLGNQDEIGLFDYPLTPTQVTSVYNDGVPDDLMNTVGLTPPTNNYRMGEDASFNGTNWTVPDNVGTNDGTSVNMDVDDLVGEAPNYSGGGISSGMTIEDRVGNAPNSDNNALSINMEREDRVLDVPL
jgi:hypothetical protein